MHVIVQRQAIVGLHPFALSFHGARDHQLVRRGSLLQEFAVGRVPYELVQIAARHFAGLLGDRPLRMDLALNGAEGSVSLACPVHTLEHGELDLMELDPIF